MSPRLMPAACWAIRSRWRWSKAAAPVLRRRCMCPCLTAILKSRSRHRFSPIPPERASMPEIATRSLPPVPQAEWTRALPPAMRFILHGGVGARTAAGSVWGVAFAEQSCRAMMQAARATLWLGPDEYLLLGGIGSEVAG